MRSGTLQADRAHPASGSAGLFTGRFSFTTLLIVLVGTVTVSTLLAVGVGAVTIAPGTAAAIIGNRVLPGAFDYSYTAIEDRIVWQFRLPRAIFSLLVGAGLAVVGAVLQAVVRNPLADPFLLGISSGGALGAVLVLVYGSTAVGGLGLSAAAFSGSLFAGGLVYLLAQRSGQITPGRLLLAGVAMAYLFQAIFSYVLQAARTGQAAQQVLFWLLGSLASIRWDDLVLPSVVLGLGLAVLMVRWRGLNALVMGEETAASLGINVTRFRIELFVVTSLLVGVLVALTGAIAFVGLIIPHTARLLVGADHRRVLPVSALIGAGFLQLVDLSARTLKAPAELPLSIVTALFGVPFFLWLLRRRSADASVGT
ncbi:MAG: FecCD family ABC transporter permease [Actinomycetota bacterium]